MDYAELAVQFGYITLFVVSFPLAPLLALANNYVEFRSDAFKLLTQMQRPVPRGAEDIGSWQAVFTTISCIAVVTNSALVSFVLMIAANTGTTGPRGGGTKGRGRGRGVQRVLPSLQVNPHLTRSGCAPAMNSKLPERVAFFCVPFSPVSFLVLVNRSIS